ncbi:MAG: hypothetical protein NWE93_06555 [Candidatus Bathyarchaeota archaeon]|nr:hypothetical protein [Candidatus Bathyarchaeota archaeon]
MQSKAVALTITFAAIAIALNAVRIPTIFWARNFFQFSQIPIVVAFLLFGLTVGILVGFLNLLGALALFPLGLNGVVAYSMDFVSLLVMFVGLYLASKLVNGRSLARLGFVVTPLVSLTASALLLRGSIMPLIDYSVLYHVLIPTFFGLTFPEVALLGLVPIFVLYNIVTVLYTVPIAYMVASKASKHLNIQPNILCLT